MARSGKDVADLKLEDAGLSHSTDREAATVLVDDLVFVAHLKALPLCNRLFDGAAAIFRPPNDDAEVSRLHLLPKNVGLSIHPVCSEVDARVNKTGHQ